MLAMLTTALSGLPAVLMGLALIAPFVLPVYLLSLIHI